MTRTPTAAVAVAREEVASPSRDWKGLCLMFVRTCMEIPVLYPDADAGWAATKVRGTGTPPAGAAVWWAIGEHGHVALSTGDGRCVSTDIKRTGKANEVEIALIATAWGARYRGWSWDVNGVSLLAPGGTIKPPATPSKGTTAMTLTPADVQLLLDTVIRKDGLTVRGALATADFAGDQVAESGKLFGYLHSAAADLELVKTELNAIKQKLEMV